jgi:ABC-type antimicrobial peptide transport system permease subunit
MGSPLASFVTYVLRVDRPDPGLALAAEREILAVHDQAIVSDGATMRQRLLRSVNDRSFATLVAVFFAVAAVGVSAAGLVGVVGCVVARRTREMAVRMALGATASDVVGLATREATCAAAAGAAAGLLVAWSTSRVLDSLLFGIGPAHAGSFAIAACLVVGVVALSAWMPARRATRLSPAVALRVE